MAAGERNKDAIGGEEGGPVSQELDRAMKKIGELSMENELLRKRCEAQESLRRRRSR
jgi:hypothetical protein